MHMWSLHNMSLLIHSCSFASPSKVQLHLQCLRGSPFKITIMWLEIHKVKICILIFVGFGFVDQIPTLVSLSTIQCERCQIMEPTRFDMISPSMGSIILVYESKSCKRGLGADIPHEAYD